MKNFLKLLHIDEYSITPKYVQLVNCMISAIENGQVVKGDLLPSISDLSVALDISKNTTEHFYNDLKQYGIIATIHGKGTYVCNTEMNRQLKILLLFNKLSMHKKIIYDSFINNLEQKVAVDFYIYNNDFNLFKKILTEKLSLKYDKYVILPYFLDSDDQATEIINMVPKNKLVIMDKILPGIAGKFSAVLENFELDIYCALKKLNNKLRKYKILKIIYPQNSYYSKGIPQGFINFCYDYSFEHEIINELSSENIKSGNAYISIVEEDLIMLIQKIKKTTLVVGEDVGIISYNETEIKRIILNGITTISTDFSFLGAKTAEVLLNGNLSHLTAPFTVNERSSL